MEQSCKYFATACHSTTIKLSSHSVTTSTRTQLQHTAALHFLTDGCFNIRDDILVFGVVCLTNVSSCVTLYCITAFQDWHNVSNAHVPYNELCHCLCGSLAPILHTLFCNPIGHGHCCMHYPAVSTSWANLVHFMCPPSLVRAYAQHTLSFTV
jgi:hypothetical protein